MQDLSIDPRLDQIKDALYRVSAKAIIIRDHKILLVQEKDNLWWSLPGGGIDHGETITSTLQRELGEELGVAPETITVDEQIIGVAIGQIVTQIPRAALLYRVNLATDEVKKTEDVVDIGWFTAEELEQLSVSPTVGGKVELLRHLLS